MSRSKKRRNKPANSSVNQPAPVEPPIPAGGGPRTGLLRLAQLLFTVALGISLYLAYTSYTSGSVAGCGAGSGCSAVLASRWAYWFSLPVSAPASVFYLILLGASLLTGASRKPQTQARAWTGLIAGAFAVLGAALWFVGLQGAILGKWCPYCVTAHVLGGTGAVLVLMAAPFVIRGPGDAEPVLFGVNRRVAPALVGILALIPLVVGQYFGNPPSAVIATIADEKPAAKTPAAQNVATHPPPTINAASSAEAAKPSRMFSLYNGRFTFDLYEAPLIGRPDAPNVIVSLFDYTCTHCRQEHFMLKRVQAVFGRELAVALLPMPLDTTCNPLLRSTSPDHVDACQYARIGMAVWRARPGVYGEYEEWFFATERPRPLAEVKARAIELTGRDDFDKVVADPWIDEWLKLGRDLFKANWDASGRSYLPMLNFGHVMSSGELKNDQELYDILEKEAGLKPPSSAATSATNH